MLSREEIKENTKCISIQEYSNLIANNHLSRTAREKCIEMEQELQQLRLENEKLRRMIYGDLSEKERIRSDICDMLINESELSDTEDDNSRVSEEIHDIVRQIRRFPPNDELNDHISYIFRAYYLDDEMNDCDSCSGKYRVSSMVPVSSIKIIDSKAVVSDEIFMGYKCDKCGRELSNSFDIIDRPCWISGEIKIDASVIANIIVQKFLFGRSFKTQELYWRKHEITFSHKTMSYLVNEASDKWVIPLYEYMKKELLKRDFICADVRTVSKYKLAADNMMLSEDNTSELYLYRTPANDSSPIVIFDIEDSSEIELQESDRVKCFLKKYSGILQTEKTERFDFNSRKYKIAALWSHVCELFGEALEKLPPAYRDNSNSAQCLELCSEIMKNDDDSKPVEEEEVKLEVREHNSRDITDCLTEIAESFVNSGKDPSAQSSIGKAYNYLLDYSDELEMYYTDARTSVDNELCNEILKDFTLPDKNKFASVSKDGIRQAAMLSLIYTIRLNGVDPIKYLTYFFRNAPAPTAETRKKLMPWNCPDCCRPLFSSEKDEITIRKTIVY